jgi:hypothetical protein
MLPLALAPDESPAQEPHRHPAARSASTPPLIDPELTIQDWGVTYQLGHRQTV